MAVPAYATPAERVWYYVHRLICGAVLLFLISPILAIMPLSFNSVPFFTYPMPGFSLRWYEDFFLTDRWQGALRNSIFVASSTTVWRRSWAPWPRSASAARTFPFRTAVMSMLISPIVVPVVITAVGMYFFYADVGLLNTYTGLILAHTTLAAPSWSSP
jgi:ABC-type spermidine/putrescine transport system, permease component II